MDPLARMHLQSVGRNCNLVLGEVITPEGLAPEMDIQRLAEFGRELKRRWGTSVADAATVDPDRKAGRGVAHGGDPSQLIGK